jgi:hypothetical protein
LINNRKTVSDILIGRVKKMGLDPSQPLSKEVCAELALKSSSQLLREIESTKMSIINLE